jgi:FAD/FMN-containing dehydrogenase
MTEIVNWSGSVRFRPARFELPASPEEVASLVRHARKHGHTVRPVGSRHSSSPIFRTDDTLISLDRLTGLRDVDSSKRQATFAAGTSLEEAGPMLDEHGLAFHNLGDIDQQTLSGVIATGTHGTGRTLQNLATMLIGGRYVNAQGELAEFSIENDPHLVRAFRVSLGALGILTDVRLQLIPSRQLHRFEWCSQIDDFLPHWNELAEQNRCADFYWYPRSDRIKLRTINFEDVPKAFPFAVKVERDEGRGHEVIAQRRRLKFEEMEYALPAEAGMPCFLEIRKRVKSRHRKNVGWRILYRTVAADDACLSPAYGRDTVTISLLQNATLPCELYFRDIEPIFLAHGGRPHWGKIHHLSARELRERYPRWEQFAELRTALDPEGVFLTPPMRALLLEQQPDVP